MDPSWTLNPALIPRWRHLGGNRVSIVTTAAAREAAAGIEIEATALYGLTPRALAESIQSRADNEAEFAFWENVLSLVILRESGRQGVTTTFEVLDGTPASEPSGS